MDALRTQIAETQKARSDLMKWKLILVAGLGAAGLGLGSSEIGPWHSVLCVIPLVCVYVDALCAHLSLRIRAIGDFLAAEEPKTTEEKREHQYELFLRSDKIPFRLETVALHWSTVVLSLLIAGSSYSIQEVAGAEPSPGFQGVSRLSGVAGIGLTFGVWVFFRSRIRAIKNAAATWADNKTMVKCAPAGDAQPDTTATARETDKRSMLFIPRHELLEHFTANARRDVKVVTPTMITEILAERLRERGKDVKDEECLDGNTWSYSEAQKANKICVSSDFGLLPATECGPFAISFATQGSIEEFHYHEKHWEVYFSEHDIYVEHKDDDEASVETETLRGGGAVAFSPGVIHRMGIHGLTLP